MRLTLGTYLYDIYNSGLFKEYYGDDRHSRNWKDFYSDAFKMTPQPLKKPFQPDSFTR